MYMIFFFTLLVIFIGLNIHKTIYILSKCYYHCTFQMKLMYMDPMPNPEDLIGINVTANPDFYYPIGATRILEDGSTDVVCDEGLGG